MQPDMLLQHPTHGSIILDTKWKRPGDRPAENDLRQLFAYAHHFEATQARRLYPQAQEETAVEGAFTRPLVAAGARRCKLFGAGFPIFVLGKVEWGLLMRQ